MSSNKNPLSFLFLTLSLLLSTVCIHSQTYSFKKWGAENGLPDLYIYTLEQDKDGFLWIGTGSGLVRFDGFTFYNITFPDSVSSRYVSAMYRDGNGNLWLGCNDGALFYSSGGELKKIITPEIQSINQIIPGDEGSVLVIPQDKMILRISINKTDDVIRYLVDRNIQMTSACFAGEDLLLIGTQENLLLCRLTQDSVKVTSSVQGIEFTKVQVIAPAGNGYGVFMVGTEGAGLYRLKINDRNPELGRFSGDPEFELLDIKGIISDSNGKYWISTYGSGLLHIRLSAGYENIETEVNYNSANGLPGDNVRIVFRDAEENTWAGLYGEGLAMLSSDAFSYYAPSDNPDLNNIIFIDLIAGKYLLGTSAGYYTFNLGTGKTESFTDLSRFLTKAEILSYRLDNRRLWIGTKGNGLYYKDPSGSPVLFFRTGNAGEDYVRHINISGGRLWLSTLTGVIVLDKNSGTVIRRYKTDDRLPHNSINQVYIRKNGEAIIATECDRIYTITENKGVTIGELKMAGLSKNKVLCFTETPGGDIFAGTAGNGLFHFTGDSVYNVTTADGLFSNYCYSIYPSLDGRIWIGHERGFSRYNPDKGLIRVFSTDFAGGGDCNENAVFESADSVLMLGTSEGLIVYDRQKDRKKKLAPYTNIVSVTINNVKYPLRQSYSLPYAKYTVRIDYVGINLGNSDKVFYNTKLENFDDNWSDLKSDRSIIYPLRDGHYRFFVTSINEEGLSQDQPAYIDIFIKRPFWRTWWFLTSIILAAGLIVVFIVREREKAQKKVKEYLESELAARTRLVMQQKDEIELQNIEITDSINYAKRIQTSILPDINRLKETFSDAFILFHPRDIVSGDFYWFDKIDDEKFIIVCADSTGHGVPGAFMSMIGSALLQDIISRKKITTPSQILSLLDDQIFSTLNQNVDVGVSNDGMDMVVCEINTKTRHIRFASAMRPVIIVMGGESYYIKGNRCSVGGESVIEKFFDDQEYYLGERDSIYMFSDGLPDQFGGADGKKMKIARLKKFIEEMSIKPMSEQRELISDFFFEWKGDYEQVDDILLMGIRV